MKKVVSPETVAHLWANESQSDARNSGNTLYFNGATIYSYGRHFAMAKHITNERGEKATLITTRTYSNSTSSHQSYVRRAASHLNLIYVHAADGLWSDIFSDFEKQVKELNEKLVRAKSRKTYYAGQIADLERNATKYATFRGLTLPESLQAAFDVRNSSDMQAAIVAGQKAEDERQRKAEAEAKAAHAENVKKWKNFETSYISRFDGFTYLRFNVEKNRVETSQGVEMNYSTAKQLFVSIREAVKAKTFGGLIGQQVLNYTIRYCDSLEIQIGCHRIELTEVFEIAAGQSWEVH